ncbi:hypothetical protein CULC0102_1882 [Corynebacterium ulcerans 0102]|nr:hypothetical protein CULC0102_1882 [Corynebacterium ulcerans 0102]
MPFRELPPHTRRKEKDKTKDHGGYGTTSAYAEKSRRNAKNRSRARNYLRIRGEKDYLRGDYDDAEELPPHTRRKATRKRRHKTQLRTTSAYAEKRTLDKDVLEDLRNYLRIRGEKPSGLIQSRENLELPPHTRRKDTLGGGQLR